MSESERTPPGEITPPALHGARRAFLKAGLAAASVVTTGAVYRRLNRPGAAAVTTREVAVTKPAPPAAEAADNGFRVGEPMTPLESVISYNNFYEFTTDKEGVADAAAGFVTRPWRVAVGGLVHRPQVFDLDDLRKLFPVEERVYRMRCVEAWSMVIPWLGFPLARLLDRVEPKGEARYVAFESLADPAQMPNLGSGVLPWPYVEGLRLDEAMHPLTIMAVGLYGHELPGQNGAPLRLVVPWKYGFKGIKSVVKITVRESRPPTTWNTAAPGEYGFYANVNPDVAHPRWSQATEQRIGEGGRRRTLPFNGYGPQVAHLYSGLDLRSNY